ncbi:MAG: M23 family metallopeptidase [Candidatus Dadabacteria bacterium]|nr:MAG: M23 family metallopeptidase [Candidatus Dadabacteria bacterium]
MTVTQRIKHLILFAAALLISLHILTGVPSLALLSKESAAAAVVYPIFSPRKSSAFGVRAHPIFKVKKHHDGIDLAAPKGTPIRSIMDGWVVFAGRYKGYGKLVTVRHKNGFTSHYAHCDTIKVKVGQHVTAGEIIAVVGSTGAATGPHLHFEIRLNGKPYNPEWLLPGLSEKGAG